VSAEKEIGRQDDGEPGQSRGGAGPVQEEDRSEENEIKGGAGLHRHIVALAMHGKGRLSVGSPQGIDDLQTGEVLFVIGDEGAIICFGDCGNDHVEGAPRPPGGGPVGHQARPDEAGLLIERQHAAGEQRLGPSGLENQRSSSLRFFPAGFSSTPRRISATVIEEMNKSSSACAAIHPTRAAEGTGLVMLLMIFVSRRWRLKGPPYDRPFQCA